MCEWLCVEVERTLRIFFPTLTSTFTGVMCLGHLYNSYPMFNSVQAGGWLELIPVDWQGIMAILEVLLLFNILQEARKNKRDIQMRVRSERLQFYAFFWKKWDRILEALPHGIFEPDFDASTHDREALIVTLRSYFDLCAQEYFMYTEGVIEESIWANWKRGLISCMSLPIFRETYAQLKVEMSHPEFHEWLADELASGELDPPEAQG